MVLPLVVGAEGPESGLRVVDWVVDEAVRHGLRLRIVHASLWERYEGATYLGARRAAGVVVRARRGRCGACDRSC
jgi:hypothetical protein